ncbi:LemA family protein [Neisseria chenwenguii]|uniref:Uncharacterized protein n=1 Tax=Neisseria chenwenguii TaxID=1853278 RepID=A0A220RZY3_9NEIS|nr:LemA family protein [Neisseria chenwenguii]ASK26733.1 hypothetical protein BG910_02315 [Neisseria chenwenguii]ROV56395.1 hypothetical protein EGS38_05120 [Neisseria chenwenguii]
MGMLSLLFAAILLLGLMMAYRQKLEKSRNNYQDSFVALKIALSCRHQAVKYVLDAAQLYLLNDHTIEPKLLIACTEAEQALSRAAKSFSSESVAVLSSAEAKLNGLLKEMQPLLDINPLACSDKRLSAQLEMLDAAESDVVVARRAYNRAAERYNQLTNRFPFALCAGCMGYKSSAGLVKFQDNNVTQMSRQLLV